MLPFALLAGTWGVPVGIGGTVACGGELTFASLDPAASQRYEDCVLSVSGGVTIRSGVTLDLVDSWLRFVGQGAHVLSIESGGRVHLNASTVSPWEGSTFQVRVAGTLDAFAAGSVHGASVVELPGASSRLRDVSILGSVGTGLRVSSSPADPIENVTVAAAQGTAVVVTGSSVEFRGVAVSGGAGPAVQALQSQVRLVDSVVHDSSIGMVLGTGADVTVTNSSVANGDREALLSGEGARLRLVGTRDLATGAPPLPDEFELAASARGALVESASWIVVRALAEGTGAPILNASVELRSPGDDAPNGTRATGSDGRTVPALLPHFDRTQNQTRAPGPWDVFVTRFHNSNSTIVDPAFGNQEVLVRLSNDLDSSPPRWESPNPLRLRGRTVTNDTNIQLEWDPANDSEPARPNSQNRVHHYQVLRLLNGGLLEPVLTTSQTAAILPSTVQGFHQYRVQAFDLVGNAGNASAPVHVTLDTVPPASGWSIQGVAGPAPGWYRSPANITALATDAGSGLAYFNRSMQTPFGGVPSGPVPPSDNLTQDGAYVLRYVATDRALNRNATEVKVGVDQEPPTLAVEVIPGQPNGEEGWYRSTPVFVVNATDPRGNHGSGVHHVEYRTTTTPNATQVRNGSFALQESGYQTVSISVTDGAGNAAHVNRSISVDRTPPVVSVRVGNASIDDASWFNASVGVTLSASDNASGVRRVQYALGAESWRDYSGPISIQSEGVTRLFTRAFDRAGNGADTQTHDVRLDATRPDPGTLTATHLAPGHVELDWGLDPPWDGASGVDRAVIERRVGDSGAAMEIASVTDPVLHSTYAQVNVPNGLYEYRLTAWDRAGNAASTSWVTVRVEAAATPLEGDPGLFPSPVRGTIVLRPLGLDPGRGPVVLAEFFVDDRRVGSSDAAPYEFEFDTRSLADGSHHYAVLVRYEGGTYEEQGQFVVDNDVALASRHLVAFGVALGLLLTLNAGLFVGLRALSRKQGRPSP